MLELLHVWKLFLFRIGFDLIDQSQHDLEFGESGLGAKDGFFKVVFQRIGSGHLFLLVFEAEVLRCGYSSFFVSFVKGDFHA